MEPENMVVLKESQRRDPEEALEQQQREWEEEQEREWEASKSAEAEAEANQQEPELICPERGQYRPDDERVKEGVQ